MDSTLPNNWLIKFSVIWMGQAFSLLGSALVQFALVWWLTAKTGSATVLAVGTLVALLPAVLVGPAAGAFVDRHSRRWIMVLSDSFTAVTTLWLVILASAGWMQVGHVFAAMFLRGTAGAFQWPAMQASTTLMVPGKHLARVGGMNQALYGLLGIVAPPAGALLVLALPLNAVLAIDIATAALAVLPLLAVAIPQPAIPEADGAPRGSIWRDMRTGFQFLRAWKGGMQIITVAVVVKFFLNPAFALLPILAVKYFGGGALEIGWLDAASGIGTVAGGLILSVWGGFRKKIVTILFGLVGIGVGMILVGATPATLLWMALAAVGLTGLMGSLIDGPIFALMQSVIPAELQGRVMTVFMSLVSLTVPFGMIFGGLFADGFGVSILFLVAGLVCLIAAFAAFATPSIMNMEQTAPGSGNIRPAAAAAEAD